MERWSASIIYPVTACALGVVAAFAFAAVAAPIWASFAIGLSTAVGALALRNWWIGEEERPLLAEELLGLHEAVDALRSDAQELRDLMSEAVELTEYRISEDAGAPAAYAAADAEAALEEARRAGADQARRIAKLEARIRALEEEARRASAPAPSAPTPFVDRFEARLDAQDARTRKLVEALTLAIEATGRHAKEIERLSNGAEAPPTEPISKPISKPISEGISEGIALSSDQDVERDVDQAVAQNVAQDIAAKTREAALAPASPPHSAPATQPTRSLAEELLARERAGGLDAPQPAPAIVEPSPAPPAPRFQVRGAERRGEPAFSTESPLGPHHAPDRTAEAVAPQTDTGAVAETKAQDDAQYDGQDDPQADAQADARASSGFRVDRTGKTAPLAATGAAEALMTPADPDDAGLDDADLGDAMVLRVQPIFLADARRLSMIEVLPDARADAAAARETGALLDKALDLVASFRRQGARFGALFKIDLSALRSEATLAPLLTQLRADPDVARMLAPAISQAEIAALTNQDFALMRRLADVGVRLALRDADPAELDLDRAIDAGVRHVMLDAARFSDREAGAVGRLAERLVQRDVALILEGVDTEAMLALAAEARGAYAQGDALAPPRRVRLT